MQKVRKIFAYIGITLFIWLISRFIPSLIRILLDGNTSSVLFAYIIALPIGWVSSRAITKGKHAQCIRVNLYIFAIIEMLGICDVLNYLLQELSFYTGRYSVDAYGIAYSDYFSIYGALLLLEISYIAVCFILAKRTPSTKADSRTAVDSLIEETPVFTPSIIEDVSTTESTPPIAPAHNSAQRYCRMCGGAIDLGSKKCTKCGKQYFNLRFFLSNFKKVFLIGLILALIASNIYLIISFVGARNVADSYKQEISALEDQISEQQALEHRIDELNQTQAKLNRELNELTVEQSSLRKTMSLYDEHVVFGVIKENYGGYDLSYHKYNCIILESLLTKDYDEAPKTNSGVMSFEEWKAWKNQQDQKASAAETVIIVSNINSVDAKKLTCPHCFD